MRKNNFNILHETNYAIYLYYLSISYIKQYYIANRLFVRLN